MTISGFDYTVAHRRGGGGGFHTNADAKKEDYSPMLDLNVITKKPSVDEECQKLRLHKNYKMSPERVSKQGRTSLFQFGTILEIR